MPIRKMSGNLYYAPRMLKQKWIRRNRIASVDYVGIEETINHIISECSKLVPE